MTGATPTLGSDSSSRSDSSSDSKASFANAVDVLGFDVLGWHRHLSAPGSTNTSAAKRWLRRCTCALNADFVRASVMTCPPLSPFPQVAFGCHRKASTLFSAIGASVIKNKTKNNPEALSAITRSVVRRPGSPILPRAADQFLDMLLVTVPSTSPAHPLTHATHPPTQSLTPGAGVQGLRGVDHTDHPAEHCQDRGRCVRRLLQAHRPPHPSARSHRHRVGRVRRMHRVAQPQVRLHVGCPWRVCRAPGQVHGLGVSDRGWIPHFRDWA